jgi:hypothetical protein
MTNSKSLRFIATFAAAALGLGGYAAFAHGDGASAEAAPTVNLGCGPRSLKGAYAIQGSGSFVPPGSPLPFTQGAAIPVNFQNLALFDGRGAAVIPRGVDVLGGIIERDVPNSGTYTLDADCTGELVLTTDHSPELGGTHVHHVHFIVAGERVFFTFMDPGATGSAIGVRIPD